MEGSVASRRTAVSTTGMQYPQLQGVVTQRVPRGDYNGIWLTTGTYFRWDRTIGGDTVAVGPFQMDVMADEPMTNRVEPLPHTMDARKKIGGHFAPTLVGVFRPLSTLCRNLFLFFLFPLFTLHSPALALALSLLHPASLSLFHL